jgi:RimJ/RimL family protein N-acetyltransferase
MELKMRMAGEAEMEIYFNWTNDPMVRANSYQTDLVSRSEHANWFRRKLSDQNCILYYFSSGDQPVGQVRIEKGKQETVIGISVDQDFRGKGISPKMLELACRDFFEKNPGTEIYAYIKEENSASLKAFIKAGFKHTERTVISSSPSFKLKRTHP